MRYKFHPDVDNSNATFLFWDIPEEQCYKESLYWIELEEMHVVVYSALKTKCPDIQFTLIGGLWPVI